MATEPATNTLVPLGECKTALGLDDRDDDFSRFLLYYTPSPAGAVACRGF